MADCTKHSRDAWFEFARRSAEQGARSAHASTKPLDDIPRYGDMKEDPAIIFQRHYDSWASTWVSNRPPGIVFDELGADSTALSFPRPSIEHLILVLLAFKSFTGIGVDALHPKELARAGGDVLHLFLDLLMACGLLGRVPNRLMDMFVAMVPNPTVGFAPYGVLGSRTGYGPGFVLIMPGHWKKGNHRPYFAASAGCSALSLAEDQALMGEVARGVGALMISIFLDISKCYDNMYLGTLLQQMRFWGFPVRFANLIIRMYHARRFVVFSRSHARGGIFFQGVVAGWSFATTCVKIFVIQVVDGVCQRHQSLANSLRIFVDDTSATLRGFSINRVGAFFDFVDDLTDQIDGALFLPLNVVKSKFVANRDGLRDADNDRFRAIGILLAKSAPFMGVDISFWNVKGGHGETFRKRLVKFRRRHSRIRRLGRAGGPASRVPKTDMCPRVLCPASVYGISDKTLAKVRSMFATACGHWRAGSSATLVLATAPLGMLDPTYQASFAPILEVAKRVF